MNSVILSLHSIAGAISPSIFVGRYGYLKARAKRRGYSVKENTF